MNRDLLFRFFEGKTSSKEEDIIKNWVDESEENFGTLLNSRKEYDIQLFTIPKTKASKYSKRSVILNSPWISTIAAVAILLLIISGFYFYSLNNDALQYNTINVPAGQRINIILSDNTNLWLNSNTIFRYPSKFSKKERTVFLDGEAYFEVSKDNSKLFIVKTEQGNVHVTGTTFNIEAYSKYNSFKTSLFEGSVNIIINNNFATSLKPNEKSILDNGKLIINKITDTDEFLWREGIIAFNNKELDSILFSLEKYFDVDISINNNDLPEHKYTGKFRQSDGVDYALRVLQKSINFSYQRDENTGIIYIK